MNLERDTARGYQLVEPRDVHSEHVSRSLAGDPVGVKLAQVIAPAEKAFTDRRSPMPEVAFFRRSGVSPWGSPRCLVRWGERYSWPFLSPWGRKGRYVRRSPGAEAWGSRLPEGGEREQTITKGHKGHNRSLTFAQWIKHSPSTTRSDYVIRCRTGPRVYPRGADREDGSLGSSVRGVAPRGPSSGFGSPRRTHRGFPLERRPS